MANKACAGVIAAFKTIDSPISAETMRYATLWSRIENTSELEPRGLAYRNISDSFDDTLHSMVDAGYIDVALCPKYENR